MNGQLLPVNLDAERAILGSILLDNLCYTQAAALDTDNFSLDSHRRIFTRMAEMSKAGTAVDYVTLSEELSRHKELEAIGGVSYLASLTDGLPKVQNIEHYVKIVREKSLLRNLINAANNTITRCVAQEEPAGEIAASAEKTLAELSVQRGAHTRELVIMTLAEVTARQQRYLWGGYVPLDQLIAVYGPSHTAKTVVAMDIGARITSGGSWPDGTPNTTGPKKVLFLSAGEDALETVFKPRFVLAGGDPSKLILLKGSRPAGSKASLEEDMIGLDRDVDLVREYLATDRDIAMVVIDPITNHVGSRRINVEEEIRPILMRLRAMAEELSVPIIMIGHLNRREKGTESLDRMLGARSFSGVPRTIYLTGPDNDTTEKHHFTLFQRRGLGAPTWKYHTELVAINVDGSEVEQVRITWDGTTDDVSGQDVVDSLNQAEKTTDQEAAEELVSFLNQKGGRAHKEECTAHLFKIYGATLNATRVRRRAKVRSEQGGVGKPGFWSLPPLDKNP